MDIYYQFRYRRSLDTRVAEIALFPERKSRKPKWEEWRPFRAVDGFRIARDWKLEVLSPVRRFPMARIDKKNLFFS